VPHFYGTVFTLFAAFYSVLGGMHSIVIGDLVKYLIMIIACVSIAIIAMLHLHGNTLTVPQGWSSPFFGKKLYLDWSHIIPDVNKKIREDGFSFFSIFFMMTFKGIIASLTGPTPNYDMQKVLSTRSPKEASKMTGFTSLFLYPVRNAMITGVVVLALLYYQ
jgi:Na+(H+)/acetate symporter ActP